MLSNKYYLGILLYNKVEYPGSHEPLITPELFDSVQRVLGSRRQDERKRKHDPSSNPLLGAESASLA